MPEHEDTLLSDLCTIWYQFNFLSHPIKLTNIPLTAMSNHPNTAVLAALSEPALFPAQSAISFGLNAPESATLARI
jgi:hypothetical protein